MEIKEIAHKKFIGIPVLYIAAVGAIGIGVYAWTLRSTPVATSTDPATDATADPGSNISDTGAFSAFGAGDTSGLSTVPNPVDTTPTPDSNDAWAARAVTWLVSHNKSTPIVAQTAITVYLNGGDMTYDQSQLVNMVEQEPTVGLPPDAIGNIGSVGAQSAKRQFTTFPGVHVIRGGVDNGFGGLAQLYYGNTSPSTIDLLQAANTSIGASGPWPVGTRVTIPAYHSPKYFTATASTNTAEKIAAANSISVAQLGVLNNQMPFPVKSGTKVRVA